MVGRLARAWLTLILLLGLAAAASAQGPKRKILIDDEGFSLMHMMLLQSPDVEVIGITTVSGNVWANRGTAIALRALEIMGRTDVPVAQGALYPLLNSEARMERYEALYGKLTWKGAWMKQWVEPTQQSTPPYHGPDDPVDLPQGNPTTKPLDESAVMFMLRMVRQYPGEITIIEGGPMTNLALAQRIDPKFAGMVKELVYMGGSLNPRQVLDNKSAADFAREFANNPRREFNILFDPEAASIAARSPWKKITMVPVDPSTATQYSPALAARLTKVATPGMASLIARFETGFPLWDEIAAAVWLDPSLVTEREALYVDYNSEFGPGYGDALSWREQYQPGLGEQKADVIRSVDVKRMEAMMVGLIGGRK